MAIALEFMVFFALFFFCRGSLVITILLFRQQQSESPFICFWSFNSLLLVFLLNKQSSIYLVMAGKRGTTDSEKPDPTALAPGPIILNIMPKQILSDEAESDSIDSPICACGSSMLMGFSNAHEVLPC